MYGRSSRIIGTVVNIHIGMIRNVFRSFLLHVSTPLQKSKMRRCISSLAQTKKTTQIAKVRVR